MPKVRPTDREAFERFIRDFEAGRSATPYPRPLPQQPPQTYGFNNLDMDRGNLWVQLINAIRRTGTPIKR